jgi:Uma2 family endonuclease
MNVALRTPMSVEQFLAWAETQDQRYEFDGFQPVAMTGGTIRHNRLQRRLLACLEARLRGGPCEPLGPDAGIRTIGDVVRYPDALVTCTPQNDSDKLVSGAVVVFEIVSPGSSRLDRIVKVKEYQAVASVQRYVILEQTSIAVTVIARTQEGPWTVEVLTESATLPFPELGIEIPLADIYAGLAMSANRGAKTAE